MTSAKAERCSGRRTLSVLAIAAVAGLVLLVVVDRLVLLFAERRAETGIEASWKATAVDVHLEATSGIVAVLSKRWRSVRIDATDPEGDASPVASIRLDLEDVRFDGTDSAGTVTGRSGQASLALSTARMRRSLGPAGRFLDVEATSSGAVAVLEIPILGRLSAELDVEDGRLVLDIGDVDVLGRDVEIPDELRSTSWPLPIPSTTQLETVVVQGDSVGMQLTFGEFEIDPAGSFVDS